MTDDDAAELEQLREQLQRAFDEKVERLNEEHRVQFNRLCETAKETLREILHDVVNVFCNALKTTVHDLDTIDRFAREVLSGLARVEEIDKAMAERSRAGQPN